MQNEARSRGSSARTRSGARHPVHARPGGRPRGRQRPRRRIGSKMGIDATRKWPSEGFTATVADADRDDARGAAQKAEEIWARDRQGMEGMSGDHDALAERWRQASDVAEAMRGCSLDTPDLIAVGAHGDDVRRRRHGARTTFVRVLEVHVDARAAALPPRDCRRARSASSARRRRSTRPSPRSRRVARARRRDPGHGVLAGRSACALAGAERFADVLRALRDAGLEAIAEAPLDLLDDPATAVAAARDAGLARPAADGRTRLAGSRAMDDRVARARDLQARGRRLPRVRAAAARRSSVAAADHRLRRREADRAGAAARRQHRLDPGRLGAVRAEARAGRADRSAPTTSTVSPPSNRDCSARRRSPLEEIRGNIRAAGLEPVERDGRFERDRWPSISDGSLHDRTCIIRCLVRLGAVSYLNARPLVYGLERQTVAVLAALRRAVEVRGAAARERDRPRHDPVDRVSARPRAVPHRARVSAITSDGPVASVALFSPGAARRRSGRSPPTPARARRSRCCGCCARAVRRSTRSSCRWRRIPRAMLRAVRRRAHHRRPRAVPRPRGGRRCGRSISARSGRR